MKENDSVQGEVTPSSPSSKDDKILQKEERISARSERISSKGERIAIKNRSLSDVAENEKETSLGAADETETDADSDIGAKNQNNASSPISQLDSDNSDNQTDGSDASQKTKTNSFLLGGILLSAIAIVVMIAISTCILIAFLGRDGKTVFIPVVSIPYHNAEADDSEIISEVMNSVVVVSVDRVDGTGTGSGIILSSDGYIVTNYHVVKDATTIYVKLYGSSDFIKAELMGYAEHDDVAVLKIDQNGLRPATLVTDCSECRQGETVYAIGAPEGTDYSWTVTHGIVSAVNREIKIYDNSGTLQKKLRTIQTDAPVNPGNSGGPLINAAGQVIGIITLKLENTAGMGFALPSDGVLELVGAIIDNGNTDDVKSTIASGRPLIGVTCVSVKKDTWYVNTEDGIRMVTEDYAMSNPGAAFYTEEEGVYVKFASEGTDAYGKLLEGDIITKINNTRVYTSEQLISVLNDLHGKDQVNIKFFRDGKYIDVSITLGEAPIQ